VVYTVQKARTSSLKNGNDKTGKEGHEDYLAKKKTKKEIVSDDKEASQRTQGKGSLSAGTVSGPRRPTVPERAEGKTVTIGGRTQEK